MLTDFVRRAFVAAGIVVLALFLWKIHQALLLGFAGVLFAVLLRGMARALSARTPLSKRWALCVVVGLLLAAFVGGGWLLGPPIVDQFRQLTERLPDTYEQMRSRLEASGLGAYVADYLPSSPGQGVDQPAASRLSGVASTALNALTGFVLVLFVGIFLMVDPELYRRGIVRLVPKRRRARARQVLDALGHALWDWLLGRFVAILFVAVVTTSGLWLIGVPLALVLGVIAGILDFVPFIGPILASVPGILLAFTLGPTKVLYTALLYLLIQQLEGNVVTPIVQQQVVSLPPALLLVAMTAAGLVFGVLGVILAAPLFVVVLVLVKMLYVQDVLGDEVSVPGAP